METQLDQRNYSSVETSSRTVGTKEEGMDRSGLIFPKYETVFPKITFGFDDSTSVRQIANDDEKSAAFQEMLFTEVAKKVLGRNRKLFEELAKY